jgi:hypothetical protein
VLRIVESDAIPEPVVVRQGSRRLGSSGGERCYHDAGRKSARELRAASRSAETRAPVESTLGGKSESGILGGET